MNAKKFNWIAWFAIAEIVYGILLNVMAYFLSSEPTIYRLVLSTNHVIPFLLGYLVYAVSNSKFGKIAGGLTMAVEAYFIIRVLILTVCGDNDFMSSEIYEMIVDIIQIIVAVVVGCCLWKEFQCKAAKLLMIGYLLSAVISTFSLFMLTDNNDKEKFVLYFTILSISSLVPTVIKLIGWLTLRKQVAIK